MAYSNENVINNLMRMRNIIFRACAIAPRGKRHPHNKRCVSTSLTKCKINSDGHGRGDVRWCLFERQTERETKNS